MARKGCWLAKIVSHKCQSQITKFALFAKHPLVRMGPRVKNVPPTLPSMAFLWLGYIIFDLYLPSSTLSNIVFFKKQLSHSFSFSKKVSITIPSPSQISSSPYHCTRDGFAIVVLISPACLLKYSKKDSLLGAYTSLSIPKDSNEYDSPNLK